MPDNIRRYTRTGESMRINTDGNNEYRPALYEDAAEVFDVPYKVNGIDAACRHARQDERAKQEFLEWAQSELSPEQLTEACDRLSTSTLQLEVEVETDIGSLDQ